MKHTCYNIIINEDDLREFIDWLPDLNENEKFYCCLFARKKYSPSLVKSNDRTQLKRFLANKEDIFDKLSQLEIPVGRWKLKNVSAPQESLVVYINPNPRDVIKGAWKSVNKLCKILENHSNGHNPVAECLSAIQQSKSRNFVVDFDIDNKDVDLSILSSIFGDYLPEPYRVLETRGGYHILVKPALAAANIRKHNSGYREKVSENWYKAIQDAFGEDLDQTGDQLIPIPGCVQGGFVPRFIEIYDMKKGG